MTEQTIRLFFVWLMWNDNYGLVGLKYIRVLGHVSRVRHLVILAISEPKELTGKSALSRQLLR